MPAIQGIKGKAQGAKPMKYQLDQDGFNALDESQKALYVADGDGFKLSVEGMPEPEDVSGIKAQRDKLLEEKKAAAKRADENERARIENEKKAARERGDFEQLHKSSQEENERLKNELQSLHDSNNQAKIKSEAYKAASSIADGANAEILAEFMERRLKVSDGKVHVTNESGELTVSTLEALAKEFAMNNRYASLVRGSQATGGGASGGGNGVPSSKKHDEMTGAERAELLRTDPEKFNQLFGK